jgi:hypothetical protein
MGRGEFQRRPCESRDSYAAAFTLKDAVRRLSRTTSGCGWVPAFAGTTTHNEATERAVQRPFISTQSNSPGITRHAPREREMSWNAATF